MTGIFAETVRKVMGWCPNMTPARYRSMQPVDFEYTSLRASDRSNVENIQSKNVLFPTNTFLFIIWCAISFNLGFTLARNPNYAILIPFLVVMYFLLYFIMVKTFQANISIDENGVHLKSSGLRDITLHYRDIKSIKANKPTKPSNVVMAAMLIILAVLLTYFVISGEWQLIIPIAVLVPGYIHVTQKQDRKYHDLDTQLYIEYENKKWYELTPYYSIVTDRITASKIQAAIEHYGGAKK
ncbi:MAG TPA: DUF1673 family protein [Methanosarcinaceae archaeon]|nr:DUF1673 family protein [Methanosarcinaceae archaeon]